MDYQDNSGLNNDQNPGGHRPTPPQPMQPIYIAPPKKKSGWRVFWGIFLGLSVVANIVFFLMIIGLMAVVVTGQTDMLTEKVAAKGPRANKIALVRVEGIIDSSVACDIIEQLEHASSDKHVKAVILSVDSPGGTITGSDQIYNEIRKCRYEFDKPVVAFMRGLAASGGYYISVAADEIIAEPTTITGSVGVIMGYLVLQDLLEGKLGIEPVIIKSGERKDWPSSFRKPSEEEMQYFEEKIINPAFSRFKEIVADGREELSVEDVNRLADGSIFCAEEALEEKMIDQIGYFEDAVEIAKRLAGVDDARVVEYTRPFSFGGLLGAQSKSVLNLDRKTLYELSTPQVMYLWSVH